MSRSLRSRLDRLEADAPVERTEVWRQAGDGLDQWTCADYPGRTFNRSELDVLGTPPRTMRILVSRVGPEELGER